MITFDIRCGEVVRGHSLRFTGLRLDGTSDDVVHSDYSEHHPGKPVHPMVSLTYELTPGLESDTLPDGRDVDMTFALHPPADPAHWPPVLRVGSEREGAARGPVTHGAFGPFVLPATTTSITCELTNIGLVTNGEPPLDDGPARLLGHLVIDVTSRAATWHPDDR